LSRQGKILRGNNPCGSSEYYVYDRLVEMGLGKKEIEAKVGRWLW